MSDYITPLRPWLPNGGLDAPQPDENPYDRILTRERNEQVRNNILNAQSPDQIAQATKLARQVGALPADVEGLVGEAEKTVRANNFERIMNTWPTLGAWAADDPRGAVAAQDDHKALGLIGGAWQALERWGTDPNVKPRANADVVTGSGPNAAGVTFNLADARGSAQDYTPRKIARRIGAGAAGVASGAAGMVEALGEANQTYNPVDWLEQRVFGSSWGSMLTDAARPVRKSTGAVAGRLEASSQAQSVMGRGFLSGIESIPGSIAALGTTLATGSPMAGAILLGGTTGGQSYGEARDAGVGVGRSLAKAGIDAAIETGTEVLPERYLGHLAAGAPISKSIRNFILSEVGGEQIATLGQDYNQWAMIDANKGKSFDQYVAEIQPHALDTLIATLTTAGVMTGAGLAGRAVIGQVGAADQAQRDKQVFDAHEKAAADSTYRKRDPEGYASMVGYVAGEKGVDQVFVPAEAVRAYQQSDAYDQFEDPFAPYQAQIDEAAATGGDVVLPASFALGTLPGTAAWAAVKDDLRLQPGGMSPREAEELSGRLDEVVKELADQQATQDQASAKETDARATLVERVRLELQNAGFTPTNAAVQAELIAQRASVRAARLGRQMQPGDFDTRIVSVLPPALAQMQQADRVDLVINAMRGGKDATKQTGKSLLDFIAARGGIEDRGGDVAAMGGDKWHKGKVGRKKLLKAFDAAQGNMLGSSGANPNSARNLLDAAISEGYFPDLLAWRENGEKIDDRALLDAIGQELGGTPIYPEAARVDDVRLAADELKQMLEDSGRDPSGMSDAEVRKAVSALVEESRGAAGRGFNQAAVTSEEVRAWASEVEQRLGLKSFDVWLSRGALKLNMLIVDRAAQNSGVGTRAMEELTAFADQKGLRVVLSPAQADDAHGTTSRARLVKFYKRFGFKENKGRAKDFTVSEGMIREPQGRTLYQSDSPRRAPATEGEATGISLANSLAEAKTLARDNRFPTGRDLKLALQERSLAAQTEAGVDLTALDDKTAQRLADFVVEDALEAVQDNMNAIGWYDRAVTAAKAEMAKIFPEIATDPHSEFAFIWALAVTSNGLKVDKNFELAAKAYEAWKETGAFPADIGIGQAAKGINDGLALYSKLIDHFGSWEKARDFMVKEHTVRELEKETGIPISGEGKGEMVRGAAILGPKIGNGFFSNLYGHFDGLTMDRWLMRSVGRWRGTLIAVNPKMVAQKRTEIREHFAALSPAALKGLKALYAGADVKIAVRMSEAQVDALANETAKRSMDVAWREQINRLEGGEDLRKLGNALAKYLDGQVEQPAGTKERAFIRQVFRQALERLQQKDGLESLTMADLQALLWYPEKLLYESAKKPAGQEVSSYDDDEAPDYANAARKLVRDRLGQAVRDGDGRQSDRAGSGAEQAGRTLNQDYPRWGQDDRDLNEGPRGRITLPAAGYGTGPATIELFQTRNASTLLHELSHQWLEELRYDAELPNAPEQLKADWQTVQDWFKANGHEVSDGFIPTEAHELWARGGERYLMEGKAPSSALRRMFETFRGWLLNIYRTVDALRAPITPEIREVFDRLLATDDEITQVREQQSMNPLFKDAAGVGMTGPEYEAYTRQVLGARDEAQATLLAKTMAAIKRRVTKAYNDERKVVLADEAERLDNSPVLKSLRLMKDTPLSLEWLQDRMGQDVTDLLPKRVPPLWREGGANPDSIAEMAGFESGQQMIEVLIGAERQHRQAREGGDQRTMRARMIDEAADAEMQRRYGDDPFNDGSIEQEAIAAVNNELAGEVLASEIRLLSRKTGQRPTPYKVARDWARGKVRSGTVAEEASPGAIQRHARAVAKAGREAEKAMLAGKFDEAQRFKQQQMLSSALLAEAKAAHDEVQAAQARLAKIAKRKTMKSVDQDYLDQAHALLDDVDLGPRSQRSLDRQGKWEAWAAAREAEGYDVLRPDAFRPGTHWSKLPVETFLGLDETIGQVMHLGRLKQRLLDNQEQREWDAVFDEAVSGAGNIKGPPPADLADPGWWAGIKGKVLAGDAALLKMETVFDWLDGGNPNGVFNRIAFRPIADAQSREQDMLKDYYGRIKALFEAVPGEVSARWNDILTPPFIDRFTDRPMRINRKQAVAMALNIGNAGNLQRLADGYRVNPAAVEQYLNDTLTAEEWQFVQGVWDTIDTLWPEIEGLEKRVNGVAPEKIEPRAFATPHGQMRGGYYPAIYDTSRDYRAAENAGKETDLLEGRYTRATTRASATKERAEQVKRPILLDLGVINRHLGEVIHDVTHRESVIQANRFLSSERVRRAVDAALGQEIGNQLQPWVKFVANSWAVERAGNEGIGRFIGKMRANATIVGMGFRATTIVTQLAGYSNSVEVVGADALAKSLAQFSANPAQAVRSAMEKSGELRHRMDTLDRDLRSEIAKVAAANPATKLARQALDAKRFMFHGIGYMDMIVSVPTWMAAYSNAIGAGMSEQDAVYAGDKAVRQSQGSGAPKDLAAIQRGTGKWGEALKLMTMFYSYFSAQYQRERTLGRDVMAVDGRRSRSLPKLASRAFFLLVVPPLLTEVLRAAAGAGNPPDDDEWWTEWVLRKLTANAIGPIPLARDLWEPVWQGVRGAKVFNPSITPLQRAMDSLVTAGKDAGQIIAGKDTQHATKDLLETTGYLTGLVPGQVASATQFLVDVGNGDAQPKDVWDWVEGLSTGKIKQPN